MNLQIYIVPLIVGWLLSFCSVIIGSLIITRAFKSPGKGFFNTVLLSMVVRMLAVVVLIFLIVYFLNIDRIALAAVLFFFYFLFLILEINYLSENSNKKSTGISN